MKYLLFVAIFVAVYIPARAALKWNSCIGSQSVSSIEVRQDSVRTRMDAAWGPVSFCNSDKSVRRCSSGREISPDSYRTTQ